MKIANNSAATILDLKRLESHGDGRFYDEEFSGTKFKPGDSMTRNMTIDNAQYPTLYLQYSVNGYDFTAVMHHSYIK